MSQPASVSAHNDQRQFVRSMVPRMIILAFMCILVQGLMGLSYMGAFGKPDAKNAPFLVVSHHEGNAGYIANKLNAVEGQPVRATISTDEKAALQQVREDKVVGVYVFNPSKTEKKGSDDLYYASAQGASRAQVAQTVGRNVADKAERGLKTHDLVKAAPDDARGTASFYLVLSWLVGAYLLPSAMTTAVGTRARSALGARMRLLLFAGYALLSGVVGTAIAQYGLDALRGDFWPIALMGAALVFAVSTFTYGLTSLFGTIGIGLSILIFVILGNPSAGGAFAYDVLPEPWRTVGPYLPNGAGVDAVRSLSYFGGVDLERPLWVVLAWAVAGLWMIWMVGNNTYRFSPQGVSEIEDDSVGVVGEFVEHHLPSHSEADASEAREPAEKDAGDADTADDTDVDADSDAGDHPAPRGRHAAPEPDESPRHDG
ncbi:MULTISPECIES: ABC transporter permease [Dermacoccus]|uniref:ABC transporter permease n=1 Tax=Dermacoccus TaxID=57495 RepID=UPI00101CBC18|nr:MULTISPECIES: ABC transporter permease [Dermacoccus]MBZ4497102.1 ABC transporter permease [Dermacoccus sp. Tok2021]QNK53469.1 ABC transporter permease [Dermacoccus sp. PAMC28757]RYI21430.1 ABC transporter permease [Dermacoccus sp. 147Ba]